MESKSIDRRTRNLVTGRAQFVDDRMPARRMLEVALVCSPYARATIEGFDIAAAQDLPGVRLVMTAGSVGGTNNLSPEGGQLPLLAAGEVSFHGQPVVAVVADTLEIAREAAGLIEIDYRPMPPVLGVEEAIALQSFHGEAQVLERGNPGVDPGEFGGYLGKSMVIAGQEHFALETGVAWAEPGEDDDIKVVASAEDLAALRGGLAVLLGRPMSQVKVSCPRVGGGFGGKLTGALVPAGVAALAVEKTGFPVRVRLDRAEDMRLTGKQNPAYTEFHAGYDSTGRIGSVECMVYLDGGWAEDRAQSVLGNILHHLDSAYYIPNVRFTGRVCKTNLPPNTSSLSDGAAVAALIAEEIIAEIGLRLDVIPEAVRQRNFYDRRGERSVTPYGQEIGDVRISETWSAMIEASAYGKRRLEIDSWNKASRFAKRGLAAVPAKLGCGGAEGARQAGATVSLLSDGSAQVVCGEVEIGGAMRHTIAAFVAEQLGVPEKGLQISAGETDAVSASHHGDLHAEAVRDACAQLRQRLHLLAARLLEAKGVEITDLMELRFADGGVFDTESPDQPVPLGELVRAAMAEDINVSATAYVNASNFTSGGAFREFAAGAAAAEVLVDGFTGEVTVLRVDVHADVGRRLDDDSELGQVRGGFMQGLGWLSCEELVWSAEGELLTDGASGYLVPTAGDAPLQFKASLMPGYGGYPKSAGATSFCLALAVREAVRDAVGAYGKARPGFVLPCPATPEAVYFALHGRG